MARSFHMARSRWMESAWIGLRWIGARWMGISLAFFVSFALWLGVMSPPAAAIATPANQGLVSEVHVQLGTAEGELKYVPNHLTFEAGRRYKLVLENPSPEKHYFTAKDFADGVWTQKVEAGGVEIKGAIHELELRPGTLAEWFFTPLRVGTYELHCPIAGHTEAGMTGELIVMN